MIGFYAFNRRLKQMQVQLKASWKDAVSSGIAAGLSWFVSATILGHPHPVFAAVTALICLAPGLPSHGKQAIYVLTGVLTGVIVGEATLLLPPMPTEVRIAIVASVAMILASCYAVVPPIIIQAGVSAVMVFAMGEDVAGFTRFADVAVGTGIGLIFSQILFTPDPVQNLSKSLRRFFHELANNYTLAAKAFETNDANLAKQAMKSCGRTHTALIALMSAIDVARNDARWTLRGRLSSREVTALSSRYDQGGIRLYASTLLFCEALTTALSKQREEPPQWIYEALYLALQNSLYLAGEGMAGQNYVMPDRSAREEAPLMWRECARDVEMIENTLARLYRGKTRKQRLAVFRRRKILDAVRAEVNKEKKKQQKQSVPPQDEV